MSDDLSLDLSPLVRDGLVTFDLDQYLGLWAVYPERFLELFAAVSRYDLVAHVTAAQRQPLEQVRSQAAAAAAGADPQIAVVPIIGTLTKRGSSLSSSGAMTILRRQVRALARDSQVDAILLVIDSPGGTSAGTADLANEVRAAAEKKPTWAFVEDLAASAAYWIASQASRVVANDRTALVGSIGTYLGLYDFSAAAAMEGVRPVVIKSGQFKAAGFPGTEITDEQRAYWQKIVDDTQAEFSAAVARGRRMELKRVAELADGRVHPAADAQQLGLIDAIESFESTLAQLRAAISTKRGKPMSQSTESTVTSAAPQPATLAQLKEGCPGATSEFLLAQLEAGATLPQAQKAWMQLQKQELDAARQKLAESQQQQQTKTSTKVGVPPAGGFDKRRSEGGETAQADITGDPVADFNAAVRAEMGRGVERRQAVLNVARREPELHKQYLLASNPSKVSRLIAERFEQ